MIIDFGKFFGRKNKLYDYAHQHAGQQLNFKKNETSLTLGVESELQIVEKGTLNLSPQADALAKKFGNEDNVRTEALMSTFEVVTGVQNDAHGVARELAPLFNRAVEQADALNAQILSCSTHPVVHYNNIKVREDARYSKLHDRYQWPYRQWISNGMHIHIGMKDERECMRFMNFFRHFIPHFIALSASSPFVQSENTGLVSSRGSLNEALPVAPLMHNVSTWDDLRQLVFSLERAGTLNSYKDLWWDIRPSPFYGTLELRMFDMPTNLQELKAIVAFVHALAVWFERNGDWLSHMPAPEHWIARENKWRAMRYGHMAELICDRDGTTVSMQEDIETWFMRLAPIVQKYGYEDDMRIISTVLRGGSAAQRMQRIWSADHNVYAVMEHTIKEFAAQKPIPVPVSIAASKDKKNAPLLLPKEISAA